MAKPKRHKRYSAEFKKEAIRRATEEGITDKVVCEELEISTRQFLRWRDELRVLGNDALPGKGQSRDEEVTALERELAQVKKERDFLLGSMMIWMDLSCDCQLVNTSCRESY